MHKKLLALPLIALMLAACGKEEPKQALECGNPAAIQSIRNQIQETIKREARSFVRADSGFGLGATPTAVANMQSITQTFGPSHKAFLIVPMVGAFFVDLINAAILSGFVNVITK